MALNLMRMYNDWCSYRTTVDQLSKLSHRELDDLGISINDIPRVARKAVR